MVRETYSEQETFELGKEIGEHAKGGEVFTLEGDLGVGKTVFTKGFAYGLGVRDDVVESDLYDRPGIRGWSAAVLPF